ncbi:CD209 antigen-like protein E [Dicentrarchus labrax]|uniref:CD209 antigen-like protein E n=1 Tax=Dicentrarchus labrax TaxID=13489 RepID=UPI001638A58D|nr:CD209 antigen-like protein E [Dicentrarchus labrax]
MERRANFDGGFNTLICEDGEHDEQDPQYSHSNQGGKKVFTYITTPWKHRDRLVAVSLALLAIFLLIVDISLGAHYNNLKDTSVTINDTERISNNLTQLQETYKAAVETMNGFKKQLEREKISQKPTTWELKHQTKRSTDYKVLLDKLTKDTAALRSRLPKIDGGCRHCPQGWILMNSVCYYFSKGIIKTWQKSRDFCQMYGGDLLVIDSKDKENTTVTHLVDSLNPTTWGFWVGLSDNNEEGTWKWVDGTILVEGYWRDGEPNDVGNEDCAVVHPEENFFQAWNDVSCQSKSYWICEKALS